MGSQSRTWQMVRTCHLHIFLGRNSRWLSLEQRVCNILIVDPWQFALFQKVSRACRNSRKRRWRLQFLNPFFGSLSRSRNKNSHQQHVLRHLPKAYQKTSSFGFGGIFPDLVISSVLCVFRKKGGCLARMNKRCVVSESGLFLGLQGWLAPLCLTPTTYWPVICQVNWKRKATWLSPRCFLMLHAYISWPHPVFTQHLHFANIWFWSPYE